MPRLLPILLLALFVAPAAAQDDAAQALREATEAVISERNAEKARADAAEQTNSDLRQVVAEKDAEILRLREELADPGDPPAHVITLDPATVYPPFVVDKPGTVVMGNGATVKGDKGTLIDIRAENVTIRDVAFEGVGATRQNPITALYPRNGTKVLNCTGKGLFIFANGNQKPVGVELGHNTTDQNIAYFAWVEGKDWLIHRNTVAGSKEEHIVRCGGEYANVTIEHNDFTTHFKSAINVQNGSGAVVRFNKCKSSSDAPAVIAAGPLPDGDGLNHIEHRTTDVKIHDNVVDEIHLYHGLSGFEVARNSGLRRIVLEGYDRRFKRELRDGTVKDNQIANPGKHGCGILINTGPVQNVAFTGNVYTAPNLRVGDGYSTGGVVVEPASKDSTLIFSGNRWPAPSGLTYLGKYVNRIGDQNDVGAYLTPAEWNAHPWVGEDFFGEPTPDGDDGGTVGADTDN